MASGGDVPTTHAGPEGPRRLIWHWTGGRHEASPEEKLRYHYLIEHLRGDEDDTGDDVARLVQGVPVERNCRPLRDVLPAHRDPADGYAAHTRGLNGYSIGLAVCGMHGAVDRRPAGGVEVGPCPITTQQVRALIATSVQLGGLYGLGPTEEQMFSHYEAETLHGVDQVPAGPGTWKWNITWLPHRPDMPKNDVGPWLREQVARWQSGRSVDLPDRWVGLPGER